ncbi:MAG: DMT family transporter [Ruminococcaceae bacterium]|nr:DMT family transporter [Oscillospiraceae bacterium]
MNETKKKDLIGRLALLTTTLIWGTSFVVLKSTLDSVSTLYVLAFRFTGAAAIMALFSIKHLKEIDNEYLMDGLKTGICLFLAYVFQTYGLVYTTAGKNAFLTATYCVIVPFLNWIFTKQRPDRYNASAAVICIIGCGLVSLQDDFSVGIGDALTMVCGLFYALHIIALSNSTKSKSPVLISMLQFAVAGILSWVFAFLVEPFPTNIPADAAVSIVYLCVMCTAVCFFLQAVGQKYTPPTQVAIILTLESVFGATISAFVYNDPITFRLILGFVLIFAAVLISETKLSFLKIKR